MCIPRTRVPSPSGIVHGSGLEVVVVAGLVVDSWAVVDEEAIAADVLGAGTVVVSAAVVSPPSPPPHPAAAELINKTHMINRKRGICPR